MVLRSTAEVARHVSSYLLYLRPQLKLIKQVGWPGALLKSQAQQLARECARSRARPAMLYGQSQAVLKGVGNERTEQCDSHSCVGIRSPTEALDRLSRSRSRSSLNLCSHPYRPPDCLLAPSMVWISDQFGRSLLNSMVKRHTINEKADQGRPEPCRKVARGMAMGDRSNGASELEGICRAQTDRGYAGHTSAAARMIDRISP